MNELPPGLMAAIVRIAAGDHERERELIRRNIAARRHTEALGARVREQNADYEQRARQLGLAPYDAGS